MLCMAAGTLLLTSCSSDEPTTSLTGDGNVTFTAVIPGGINSRAISDGTTANKLTYAVYDENGDELSSLTNTVDINLQTSVSLNLVTGKKYTVVFWAQAEDAPYAINTTDGTVTVTETGNSQAENRDAFFASREFTVNGAVNETVTLTRPFAQINILTTDMAEFKAAGGTIEEAGLKVTAPNTLNLKDGTVSGETEYTLSNAVFPDTTEKLPFTVAGKTTTWLVSNYILMGESKETVDVTWTSDINVPSRQSITYTGVPVQRNFRTNIYGALLTDAYDYTVVINPDYTEEPGHEYTPIVVTNADDFVAAINNGMAPVVPQNVEIDIKDKGNVELSNGQSLTVEGTLNTARAQISVSGEGNVAYVTGGGIITSEGLDDAKGNRPLNAYDGGTLIVKNVSIRTEQNNGGSAVYSEGGNLDLENVTIDCHNFAIGANAGTLKVKNCNITSDSNNKEGAYSYTVGVNQGCVATFDECTLTGIQGGISVGGEGSVATINSGTFSTVNIEGKGTAHYPVYIFDKGVVIVNGGDFISGHSQKYTIFNGNNDVPEVYTWGNGCVLKGGRYNGPTINQETKIEYFAAEGYEWQPIENDPVFKWQVVKSAN